MDALLIILHSLAAIFLVIAVFGSFRIMYLMSEGAVRRELEGLYDSFSRSSFGVPENMDFGNVARNAEWRKLVEERRHKNETS